ncbi:beta-glucuronidase [Segetibacter sp. 3557_3]|uniref:exo-beta-1,4-galactosidase n=1 Tax=Segetibacter sp. 3557_3 TaxID=2547429 RepID=UPI0010587706|nr:sugar-binding domain-containing protein [Segetibacter sp. 3557_3]TDH24245.1 beta-glucuronidase [Segetibacter sp. 3557_3]
MKILEVPYAPRLTLSLIIVLMMSTINAQEISLAGNWRFATDPNNTGVNDKWFSKQLPETIKLPGSMAENHKGDDITLQTKWTASIYDSSFFFRPALAKYRQPGNIKVPFWLTPAKHYVGVAWYQKDIEIPASWSTKRVVLFLERVHIQSALWFDNVEVAKQYSLVAPHTYDLTKMIKPGKHTLTIRIDNSITQMNVGPDSHSVTDHTQGNWNGIIGKMLLQAGAKVFFHQVQVYPNVAKRTATIKGSIVNLGTAKAAGKVVLSASSFNTTPHQAIKPQSINYTASPNDTTFFETVLDMGKDVLLWDEFNPALYMLSATVTANGSSNEKKLQFAMRDIRVQGKTITINGNVASLRGTVNNCEFPLTGYPAMDVKSWERIYKIAKAHGLNHMRFHSWCPPEAAFIAADITGMYLQPEGPTWPNHGTSLGDGRFIDAYIYEETNRMFDHYGNYGSYTMLAAGNEPAGRNQATYLAAFIKFWQQKDSRRIYTGASVAMSWPLVPENEYMIKSGSRGLAWNRRPDNMGDYRQAIENFNLPYVTHEMGQWCVFPNFSEIQKYTGVYRAKNFELFREDLADHGMADRSESFLMASGKLQALCYKHEIEKALRTPALGGFQLLGLQDFPGQGTALVGVLDAFWDEKPYINAKQWSRFCNPTVPLTRMEKFVYTSDETFSAAVELYHFGKAPLANTGISWTIKDATGNLVANGVFKPKTYARGYNWPVGDVRLSLAEFKKPSKLNLEVTVDKTTVVNDWDFWVYPAAVQSATLVPGKSDSAYFYCTSLDSEAESVLARGGKVFLNAAGKVVKGKEISMQFTPVFWNTSWFKMRPPHVTGFVAQDKHPLFNDFPTAYHSELQWWQLVNRAQVMHLEDFPAGITPIVQPIDTWFMNRKLALIMEMKVGNGKLLISTANLSDSTSDPAAKQLVYSIKNYLASDKFQPGVSVQIETIKDLFRSPSKDVWNSFSTANPDELRPNQILNNPK